MKPMLATPKRRHRGRCCEHRAIAVVVDEQPDRGDQPFSLMVLLLVLTYLTSFIMNFVSHNIIGWMMNGFRCSVSSLRVAARRGGTLAPSLRNEPATFSAARNLKEGAVIALDALMIVVFLLMLAGLVWGRRQGYTKLDVTTAVWVLVMVALLLMIIEPWPRPHAYW